MNPEKLYETQPTEKSEAFDFEANPVIDDTSNNHPESHTGIIPATETEIKDKQKIIAIKAELAALANKQSLAAETNRTRAIESSKPTSELAGPELVEFRQRQSFGSRLAEYVTGMRPDDPRMIERILEDHKIIRSKYNLPDLETAFREPIEYERKLRQIAVSQGVTIRSKSDCGNYLTENPTSQGAYFEKEKQIGVDIDKTDRESYASSLRVLEHELIHALQHKQSPRMPIELMEYEAFMANGNIGFLQANPRAIEMVFTGVVGGSVNSWYKHQSREQGVPVLPDWDNPEFFLNKDKTLSQNAPN